MTLLLLPSFAFAQISEQLVSEKTLAKCYVELMGGKRVIYKSTVKSEELILTLENRLPNTEIRAPGVTGKAKVYKVFQCVKNDVAFKHGRANVLEEKQIR